MTLNWTTEGDFSEIVDALEEITLMRSCASEEVVIAGAWRFHELSEEVEGTNGAVLRITSEWHLPIASGVDAPIVADRLLDGFGNCWSLTQIERLRGSTRYRCQARRVQIRPEAAEWIDIEKAVWEEVEIEQVATLQISDWIPERQALRGHLWRISSSTQGSSDQTISDQYRIAFTEPVKVTSHHRIKTHVGEIYDVIDQDDNHNLGDLWMVDIEQTNTASAA